MRKAMPGLDVQAEFAGALLSNSRSVPLCLKGAVQGRAERRFAVYRNTVAASLIEILQARFPVVERLVGEDFFRAMAHAYVALEPPSSPLLFLYGEGFAAFIARFTPAAPLPYLADVARLEYARGLAYHAADQAPLPAPAFAALDKGRLADFTVRLHPSVHIVTSDFPVVSIWLANQAETVSPLRHRGAEAALVSRPFCDVETRRLQPGTDAFLSALKVGASIGTAVDAGEKASANFSAAEALATMIGANIAVALGEGA
jgi:putative DNA-binding protein